MSITRLPEPEWGEFRVFFNNRENLSGHAETYADIWRAIAQDELVHVAHVHFHALVSDAATFRKRAMLDLEKE